MRSQRGAIVALVAIVALLCSPALSLACVQPPPVNPPRLLVIKSTVSPTGFWVSIWDYTTFGATPGQFCACGLQRAASSVIASVDAVDIITDTGATPLAGIGGFAQNATTTADFNTAQAGNWQGFLSAPTGTVAAGQSVHIRFHVTAVSTATTVAQIQTELLNGSGFTGTDEGLVGGGLANTHLNIVSMILNIPALSVTGIALFLLLASGAFFYMRRRRATATPSDPAV